MDDASVDLAIMADSLEKTAEPLWEGEDEEEPPQDNIFLIMKDFEQKKVRADAVKQALRTECNLPTETWTTMVAATGGTAWMQMEAAATLWVNLLKLDGGYQTVTLTDQLGARYREFGLQSRNKDFEAMAKCVRGQFNDLKRQVTLFASVASTLESMESSTEQDFVQEVMDIRVDMGLTGNMVHHAMAVTFEKVKKETRYFVHIFNEFVSHGERTLQTKPDKSVIIVEQHYRGSQLQKEFGNKQRTEIMQRVNESRKIRLNQRALELSLDKTTRADRTTPAANASSPPVGILYVFSV